VPPNPLNTNEFDKDKNPNPEIQRPTEHGQPVNPLEWSQKVNDKAPHDATEANIRLQRDQVEQTQAKGTAMANGSRQFEDRNGNKINGIVETRPDGTQHVYQDNGKGGWNQSQLVTDNHGRQFLQPLDNNGNPNHNAPVTELRNPAGDANRNSNGGDNHQQQFAPPPEHSRPGQPPTGDRGQHNNSQVDTSNNTTPGKQASEQYGQMSASERQAYRDTLTKPSPGGDTGAQNAPRPEQGWRPTSSNDTSGGPKPHNDFSSSDTGQHPGPRNDYSSGPHDKSGGGQQSDHPNMVQNDRHLDQSTQPQKQNDPTGKQTDANRRPDDPHADQSHPLQGRVETNVIAGKPGGKPDGAQDLAAGKPGDQAKHGDVIHDALMKTGKPGELQIDGKLLAQLNTFRMDGFRDARMNLADMIGKFQDGKFHPTGRDTAMFEMFKGMKPEQLTGLRNWLTDGSKFDFRSLDMRTQQGISHIFDRMLDRGDKAAGRMADLLGGDNRFRGFDKVPTGEQSRIMMMEFFKGVRDAQALSVKDGAINLASLIGRNMLSDRGEFKISSLDGNLQSLISSRLQSRDLVAATALGDRTSSNAATLTRPDSTSQLVGQIKDDGRPAAGLNLSDNIRAMLIGKDGNPITRGLAPTDQQLVRPGDPNAPAALRGSGDAASADGKPSSSTDKSTKPMDSGDAKKKKEEEESAALAAMTQKQQMDKHDQQRKLEEEKDKQKQKEDDERQRKLEEEKRKEEEERRKQQEDQEFTYTVSGEKETLVQIAAKFSGRTAEHVYARNMNDIMLKEYKGKKFAVLFVGQKLIIPNNRWIDNFRMSMQSYGHIGFDGVPYDSAEDELSARFGEKWAGGAAAASALGKQKRLFSDKDDDKPVTRRSFSGKNPVSEDDRKENIRQGLGLGSANAESEAAKYTVKLGQQLRNIAQKLYGDPQLWRLLAGVNDLSTETDHRGEPLAQLRKGQQLILPTAEEIAEFRRTHTRKHLEHTESEEAIVEQIVPMELQEITITDDKSHAMDFSPQDQPTEQQDATIVAEVAQTAQHPIPKAEYTKVEVGFEEAGEEIDPLWTANLEPLLLDQFVQIVEAEIYVSDTRGLRVSLQLLHSGDWVTIYDYEIFPDETLIHQYKRTGGRTTTRRSLPAKQTKQLARNHFQNAWQSLCREYSRS
jgi:hypothetical protein